jgi:hypothetical protein
VNKKFDYLYEAGEDEALMKTRNLVGTCDIGEENTEEFAHARGEEEVGGKR